MIPGENALKHREKVESNPGPSSAVLTTAPPCCPWWNQNKAVSMTEYQTLLSTCTWAAWFLVFMEVVANLSMKWSVLHIVHVQISIFLWTLQGFTCLVSCVRILCVPFAHFHISILIYGKCYSIVCLTTGTKVHFYLLQKMHNPRTTQGNMPIFRNCSWFFYFLLIPFFLYTIHFSTDLYAYTAFQSACCLGS